MSRRNHHLFTSESVTEGHPDKMADQISDAILDAILAKIRTRESRAKRWSRPGWSFWQAKSRRRAHPDFGEIVRDTIEDIGYDNEDYGFSFRSCAVLTSIERQSGDISRWESGAVARATRG